MSKETYKVILEEEIVSEKDVVVGGVYSLIYTGNYGGSLSGESLIVCRGIDKDYNLKSDGYYPPIFTNIGVEADIEYDGNGKATHLGDADYVGCDAELVLVGMINKGGKQDE